MTHEKIKCSAKRKKVQTLDGSFDPYAYPGEFGVLIELNQTLQNASADGVECIWIPQQHCHISEVLKDKKEEYSIIGKVVCTHPSVSFPLFNPSKKE